MPGARAPELKFLQAKWAAHLSFTAVADLLHDALPIDACLNGETTRMHVFRTAERLEADLAPSSSLSMPDASSRSTTRRNPYRPSRLVWMAATSRSRAATQWDRML
jgi:hypothetical protein